MKDWIIPLLAGFSTGILSAWGMGGGTLLLLVMTLILDVDPETARTINLIYFLPTAGAGLLIHRKNQVVDRNIVRSAVPWGCAAAALGAIISLRLDTDILRRPFGIYLLITAVIMFRSVGKE